MYKQYKLSSLSELVKFTALAAILAIFADAAIAHSILWETILIGVTGLRIHF